MDEGTNTEMTFEVLFCLKAKEIKTKTKRPTERTLKCLVQDV